MEYLNTKKKVEIYTFHVAIYFKVINNSGLNLCCILSLKGGIVASPENPDIKP